MNAESIPLPEAGTVEIDGCHVAFVVERSRRARKTRLVIGPQPHVRIIAPVGVELGAIDALLAPSARWIIKHLRSIEERSTWTPPHFVSGDMVPLRGGLVRLDIAAAAHAEGRLEDNILHLSVPSEHAVALVLDGWYRAEARRVLHDRVAHWARQMGVQPKGLRVRDQRTRWGSCSSLGNLNFSWRLILAPPAVLDYVVIHELAHLVEPHHQSPFWLLVERWCPDMQRQRRWLREHGHELVVGPST